MKTSEYLEIGRQYTRAELQKSFDITDETIKTGIFRPKGHSSIWLFISQENSQPDYNDEITGTRLQFSGQSSHRYDNDIIGHREKDLEIIVFFRQIERGPFTYCGRAEYVSHKESPSRPIHFSAHLLDVERDSQTREFRPLAVQDVVREKVRFIADTHLIQVLGEQLISSEKVGVLELIKNAYDAGATSCKIWIENVPGINQSTEDVSAEFDFSDSSVGNLPGPVITIHDNGCGMDYPTLINGWLRPATTIKTSVKQRVKEERKQADARGTRASYDRLLDSIKQARQGRLPFGEKGVGRFATHRLGSFLELHTKTADDPREWKLTVDWKKFDEVTDLNTDLSSIPLDLVHQPPEVDYGETQSGTWLRIYGGREGFEWDIETLRDVGRAIAHLRSPARTPLSFDPEFICPQLDETFGIPTLTVPAPFQCTALVDSDGVATIEIEFLPPSSLNLPLTIDRWEETVDLKVGSDYWRMPNDNQTNKKALRKPQCGPFFLQIKCWIRRTSWIEAPDYKEFVAYLEKFGGIGVFRDGLAILPAQDGAKNDWLDLEKRIIKRGINISYYNMAGSVEISQEENPGLIDQTSREGMLKNVPYYDLSKLVRSIVDALNLKVIEIRGREERLRLGPSIPKATLNKRGRMTEDVLDTLAKNYDFKKDSAGLLSVFKTSQPQEATAAIQELKQASNQTRHEIDWLQEQLDALTEVAGFAISIGVALHEIEKVADNLYHGINRIVRLTDKNTDIHERALGLSRVAESLSNELKRIAPLRITRLEKKQLFSVRDAIVAATGAFQSGWLNEDIEFIMPPKSADFQVFGSFGACSQVFANLFDNATYWLRQTALSDRRIGAFVYSETRHVLISDSGPGIADTIRTNLFEPFYSLKSPPSGLGLYICRHYMRQLKRGDIRLAKESERIADYKGAQFMVVFPRNEENE